MNLREVMIIPEDTGHELEIVYKKGINDQIDIKPFKIPGIDTGLRNPVTIGNNISENEIAVRVGLLKSINQFYNKEN